MHKRGIHWKRITGLVVLILGIIVLAISLYVRGRVANVKQEINKGSSVYSNNPINKQITGALMNKLSAYETPVVFGIIGGVVLIVFGAGTMFFNRKS